MHDPSCSSPDQTCLCGYYVAPRTRREIRHALTDAGIAALEPRNRQYKIFDGGSLYLSVQVTGFKNWFYKFTYRKPLVGQQGGEHHIALGPWPKIRVADARERRDLAKRLVALGELPTEQWITDLIRDPALLDALESPKTVGLALDKIKAYAEFTREPRG